MNLEKTNKVINFLPTGFAFTLRQICLFFLCVQQSISSLLELCFLVFMVLRVHLQNLAILKELFIKL